MRFLLGVLSAAGLAFAGQAAAQPAMSPKQVDDTILKACVEEGGKPAECACGLRIAKEEMTPRQLALFPILWPIVNGPGDGITKLSMGLSAAQQAGYTGNDALEMVAVVQSHSKRTQTECKAP